MAGKGEASTTAIVKLAVVEMAGLEISRTVLLFLFPFSFWPIGWRPPAASSEAGDSVNGWRDGTCHHPDARQGVDSIDPV